MAKIICILALVISAVYAEESASLSCEDVKIKPLKQTRVDVRMDTGGNTFTPGETHQIKVSTRLSGGLHVIVMAIKTGTSDSVGNFLVRNNDTTAFPSRCDQSNPNQPDTVMINIAESATVLEWLAPNPEDGKITGDDMPLSIQFRAVFMDADDMKHSLTSISMRAEVEPLRPVVVQPDQDTDIDALHNTRSEDQIQMDAQQKKAEEIDAENQASEDDWTKEELEEQRRRDEEQHLEEMEFERIQRQEEEDRLARIRAEIRDKEEFDRLMREKEEERELEKELEDDIDKLLPGRDNEIDMKPEQPKTAGSSRVMAGVISLIMMLVPFI